MEQRSLVTFEPSSKRYHLHDLLRSVALEELAWDPARQHEILRCHAEHYFAVLQAANALYRGGHDNVGRGLAVLDAELANIRAAQHWAGAEMAEEESAAEMAQYFPNYVCLKFRLSPDEHLAALETSLAAAERRGDRPGQAMAAGNLGVIYHGRGESDRAEEMYQMSLAIEAELGGKEGMAVAYSNLASIHLLRGDLDRAEEMLLKGLAIDEEQRRQEGMALKYGNLGQIYRMRGEFDCAEEMYRRSLDLSEGIGHKEASAIQYANLGSLYTQRGELGRAVTYWWKSLALYRQIGARPQIEQVSGWLRKAGVDPERADTAPSKGPEPVSAADLEPGRRVD